MCAETLKIDIDDAEVRAMLREAPEIFNREFNRGFQRTMGAFYRKFASARLRKGGIQVRRGSARGGGGGIFVPRKARLIGFTGKLDNPGRLHGKVAIAANRSPVAAAHEFGATIRPKRGKHLFVRVKSAAAARRAGVPVKRGQKPKVIRAKKVVIKPRLGFFATWREFQPEAVKRLGDVLKRAAQATIRKAKRARRGRRR